MLPIFVVQEGGNFRLSILPKVFLYLHVFFMFFTMICNE